jgi:hypothetical protein
VVYAISVLTHLTEDLGVRWVADWRRMLKPGGVLVCTTIGDSFRGQLGARSGARYDAGEAVVKAPGAVGMNACVTHHPPSYVQTRLLGDLRLLAALPGGTTPGYEQDAWVAQAP